RKGGPHMPVITLSEEQAKLFNGAREPVEFRDPEGRILAKVHPEDWAAVERAKRARASNSPRIPATTVEAHFRVLQEAADKRMSVEQLLALYQRLKSGETP